VGTGRTGKVVKALLALLIWVLLSLGLFFMTFVYVFGNAHRVNQDEPPALTGALVYLFMVAVYALAGFGLAYWMRHRTDGDISGLS
jgi:ABC-type transport system involved in multi-copper enzyme maturation permease subunit